MITYRLSTDKLNTVKACLNLGTLEAMVNSFIEDSKSLNGNSEAEEDIPYYGNLYPYRGWHYLAEQEDVDN
jgi:hypothetical protein